MKSWKSALILFALLGFAIIFFIGLPFIYMFVLQLIEFWVFVSEKGLRRTVCGEIGCTDSEFISSIAGILGMHLIPILFLAIPTILILLWIRSRK